MTHAALDWATASRPATPGDALGDGSVVRPSEHAVVIAVVDGLGHGAEAAAAAKLALGAIGRSSQSAPERLCRECHLALHPGRGAVMGIMRVDPRRSLLEWVGVGDVSAAILRANPGAGPAVEVLVSYHGVVGRHLPVVRPVTRWLAAGDLLVLATDGVRPAYDQVASRNDTPERIAARLLEECAVLDDDALVLVACYRGAAP